MTEPITAEVWYPVKVGFHIDVHELAVEDGQRDTVVDVSYQGKAAGRLRVDYWHSADILLLFADHDYELHAVGMVAVHVVEPDDWMALADDRQMVSAYGELKVASDFVREFPEADTTDNQPTKEQE